MPDPTAPNYDIAGVWEDMVPADADRLGHDILDPGARQRWCSAVLVGGLPYLWQQVAHIPRDLALDRLELVPGDRVLIFGEAVTDIGFDRLVRDRVGSTGAVEVIDIRHRVLDTMHADELPQWQWTETHNVPDEGFDCVLVGQAVAHADVHLEYWLRKMLEGIGQSLDSLVRWNQPELTAALGPQLEGMETFEFRGVELLWGRKPVSQ